MFWELVDAILNAVLFVPFGMEVTLIALPGNLLLAGAIAAAVALLARLLTVGLPAAILGRAVRLPSGSWRVLASGGLRGGISVALALSIPSGPNRDVVLALTYFVVGHRSSDRVLRLRASPDGPSNTNDSRRVRDWLLPGCEISFASTALDPFFPI